MSLKPLSRKVALLAVCGLVCALDLVYLRLNTPGQSQEPKTARRRWIIPRSYYTSDQAWRKALDQERK